MPVSLERLIAEVEPNVITKQLTRDCIQIPGSDPDAVAQKKRSMPFSEIECLAFSYRSIAKIDSLQGLESLTKLQLDNNQITRISNIAHLSTGIVPTGCVLVLMGVRAGTLMDYM
eukprot:1137141-Pelagomonas_calceolata.AAC.6